MSLSTDMMITDAGRAAIWNAQHTGVFLELTHVSFGSGRQVPTGKETGLLLPQQTVSIAGGTHISDTQIRLRAVFPGIAHYEVSEIGIWTGNPEDGGVLFAYHAIEDGVIMHAVEGVNIVFAYDLMVAQAIGQQLTILADAGQSAWLSILAEHESDENPHSQYALKAGTLAGYGITNGLAHLYAGEPLPNKPVGTIWHDDYNSLMTWQVFNANGADYQGYASVLIGNLLLDTQPTPRAGYIKSQTGNLSKTTYAALFAWAKHNGLMVATNAWQAGKIVCADNGDGTFRIYDVRGEFFRAWDDGRGVDAGRTFGSFQRAEMHAHSHFIDAWDVTNPTIAFAFNEGGGDAIASTDNAASGTGYRQIHRYTTESEGG